MAQSVIQKIMRRNGTPLYPTMWFLYKDGELVYQFLDHESCMKSIRRRLSGKNHKRNKQHKWTYQRGL